MSAKGNRKRRSRQTRATTHPHRNHTVLPLVRTEQAARDVSASSRASIEDGRHQCSGERGRPARCVTRLAEHIFGRAELFGGAPKRAGEALGLPGGLRGARPYFVVHFQSRKTLNRPQALTLFDQMIARICLGGFSLPPLGSGSTTACVNSAFCVPLHPRQAWIRLNLPAKKPGFSGPLLVRRHERDHD